MLLKKVLIRFYKSFNNDFLRRNDDRVTPKPWELIDGVFYPYVEVPIEREITTIVGANESGKSHLLSAIKKAITGKDIERRDFCRYSPLFTVRKNQLKFPDFGTQWTEISDAEREVIRGCIDGTKSLPLKEFFLFRVNSSNSLIYTKDPNSQTGYTPFELDTSVKVETIEGLLPDILEINADVALPSSVPIRLLAEIEEAEASECRKFENLGREYRTQIIQEFDKLIATPDIVTTVPSWPGSFKEQVNDPDSIDTFKSISEILEQSGTTYSQNLKEYKLAYKLICKIGQVDPDALLDLADAIQEGRQGYANGIIDKINRQLSTNLNFPEYWVQDTNFSLKVMARDYDLVFTITDKTGTEYSFEERSQGLRYFLSYYIQYRSHEESSSGSEILVMDEPDAYLSSQAQQDLLKVFDSFANPGPGSHLPYAIQVVYVTHSPFLIDKNHGERIRVLQKGSEDEGTRVVRDASKNHYEPLRSSIGAFVGETTFIGNCNLMVEGIADQVLLAGAIKHLRTIDPEKNRIAKYDTLDLNHVTIVPAGGAPHIPYLVYLARGRDVDQPAVIVLLDSDKSGRDAKEQLQCGGEYQKKRTPVLPSEFILEVGDLKNSCSFAISSTTDVETEDLIPLPICIEAVKEYFIEFLRISGSDLEFLTENLILEKADSKTILSALQEAINSSGRNIKINKLGFARNVIEVVEKWKNSDDSKRQEAVEQFYGNFKELFRRLGRMQRKAQEQVRNEKISERISRIKKEFLAAHPDQARCDDGFLLLERIEDALEGFKDKSSQQEIDAIKSRIQNLRRDSELEAYPNQLIKDFDGFKKGLELIQYAGLLSSQEPDSLNSDQEHLKQDLPLIRSASSVDQVVEGTTQVPKKAQG